MNGLGVDQTWLYWALRAVTFYVEEEAHGIIGMVHITKERLGAVPIPVPTLEEQQAIAAFLDRETARIDALIAKKRRLIELLREKRQAVISHAVTKGLNPNAPMKDSGIEWLGQIPAHWQACRTKFVAGLYSGHTPSRDKPEYWVPEECTIPWFTLADVWQLRDGTRTYLGDTREKISLVGLANSAARLLPTDTVIVSRTASVGFAGIMPRPMATTQDFVNWVCGNRIRPRFLLHVFRAMRGEFFRLTMGSTHQTIYMPDVGSFTTPLPPLSEQESIIAFLDRETGRLDHALDLAHRTIVRLEEHRYALIAAAVAGKIDVRGQATLAAEAAD